MSEKVRIRYVPLSSVQRWERNPKRHDLDAIAASIRRHGFGDPPKYDAKLEALVYGNGRTEALERMRDAGEEAPRGVVVAKDGSDWAVPVLFGVDADSYEAAVALAIDHNNLTLGGGDFTAEDLLRLWDREALEDLLTEAGEHLQSWSDVEVEGFRREGDVADEDEAARIAALTPAADPVSEHGDLWILGDHRLLCGDAEDKAAVGRLLDGAEPRLMVTDPPYGVEYDPSWRSDGGRQAKIENDDRADWRAAWLLFPGDVVYAWSPWGGLLIPHGQALEVAGFEIRSTLIWAKPHFVLSRGHYHPRHEICWYAVRQGASAEWIGDRKQSTLWDVPADIAIDGPDGGHSNQKPVELMERPLRHHPGDVYEPFSGSGTTIIAAERQGRRCYAMELLPGFVDAAVRRWETYTGLTARLQDGDGEGTFADVAALRGREA